MSELLARLSASPGGSPGIGRAARRRAAEQDDDGPEDGTAPPAGPGPLPGTAAPGAAPPAGSPHHGRHERHGVPGHAAPAAPAPAAPAPTAPAPTAPAPATAATTTSATTPFGMRRHAAPPADAQPGTGPRRRTPPTAGSSGDVPPPWTAHRPPPTAGSTGDVPVPGAAPLRPAPRTNGSTGDLPLPRTGPHPRTPPTAGSSGEVPLPRAGWPGAAPPAPPGPPRSAPPVAVPPPGGTRARNGRPVGPTGTGETRTIGRHAPDAETTVHVPAAAARRTDTAPRRAAGEGSDGVRIGGDPRGDVDDAPTRAARIDQTLTRLTAAHAGVVLGGADEEDEPDESPGPRRRGRWLLRLPVALASLAVFAAASLGTVTRGGLERSVRDAAALEPGASAVVDADVQRGDQNVLLVGTDVAGGTTRADTLAVVHVPDGGGPPVVLVVPANLEINRPPCDRWDAASASYADEVVPAEARTPLVSALDVGGPRCAVRVVQQLTGLAVTGYVGTDLTAVGALADAAGGVGVCVAQPVVDAQLGAVVPDAGTTVLTGVAAADFARAGEVEGDPPGGAGRVARQQQMLAGVLDRALGGAALLDVRATSVLGGALRAALVTDGLEPEQVLAAARTVGGEGVLFATAPVAAEPNPRGHAVLRDTDAAALFAALREDAPLPEAPAEGTAPADVTVEVVNGSDRPGLAEQVGQTLGTLGFGVGAPGNATQPTPATIIRFSPDRAAAAALLATSVPAAEQVPDPGSSGVLQLVLGRSFDDVVQPPTVAAPAGPTGAGTAPARCG